MFCKNCGAQLTGVENVCPNCGTPVEKENQPTTNEPEILDAPTTTPVVDQAPVMTEQTPVVDQAPVEEPTPVVEPAPVVEPTPVMTDQTPAVAPTPVVAPAPAVPTMEPAQPVQPQPVQVPTSAPVEEKTAKNASNKTIILIIALVVVAIIAVVLYFVLFAKTPTAPAPTEPTTNNDTPAVSDVTTNKESYAGYTFTLPEGYTAKTDAKYGLVITDSKTLAVTVAVDYSHKYDEYKTALLQKYADQADKLVFTVDGREYLGLVYTDTDGSKGTQYITKASDSSVFVGMVVRSDFSQATTTEFSVLSGILNSATEGSTSFAAGDDVDAGKDGIKEYTFTKDNFKFGE